MTTWPITLALLRQRGALHFVSDHAACMAALSKHAARRGNHMEIR